MKKILNYIEFSKALENMADDLEKSVAEREKDPNPSEKAGDWANVTLESFLRAMARYVEDHQNFFESGVDPDIAESFPENLDWQVVYDIIEGGKIYE